MGRAAHAPGDQRIRDRLVTRSRTRSSVLQQRGHLAPTASDAPGILALADRDRLTRLLAGTDFTDTVIDEVPFT